MGHDHRPEVAQASRARPPRAVGTGAGATGRRWPRSARPRRPRRRTREPSHRREPVGARRRAGDRHPGRERRATGAHRRDGDQPGGRPGGTRQARPDAGAVALGRPGQALDTTGHDHLLRRKPTGRHDLPPRRWGAGGVQRPADRGRDQRPHPAGEPVRAQLRQAARGVPAGVDSGRQATAVRGVLPLRRRQRPHQSTLARLPRHHAQLHRRAVRPARPAGLDAARPRTATNHSRPPFARRARAFAPAWAPPAPCWSTSTRRTCSPRG